MEFSLKMQEGMNAKEAMRRGLCQSGDHSYSGWSVSVVNIKQRFSRPPLGVCGAHLHLYKLIDHVPLE